MIDVKKETTLLVEAEKINKKVCVAINPMTAYDLPLVAVVLENYAEALKRTPEFSHKAYAFAKESIKSSTIAMLVPKECSKAVMELMIRGMQL